MGRNGISCTPHLFSIDEHRAEDGKEYFELHDEVNEVDGEIENVPLDASKADQAVENMINYPLWGEREREESWYEHLWMSGDSLLTMSLKTTPIFHTRYLKLMIEDL